MELTPIYEGPTVFAQMLREELSGRGITAVMQAGGPFMAVIGEAAQSPFSILFIPAEELEHRREQIEDCLALFTPVLPDEGAAEEPG